MTIAKLLEARAPGDIIALDPDETMRAAVEKLTQNRIGAMPVIADGKVVGVFSERDVIKCLQSVGDGALDSKVSEAMTSPAVTVTPQTSVLGALSQMTERRFRHLPVLDGERMVGFVSIGDLVKYRMDRIEAEKTAMRDYIQTV
ncbi:CBS domain-containing protein [Novosphingopyxis sp. YJ-S2-01]|uniref:CBS domain-containing protein n=1 Tax=Novosphingopyxis sp. YJ-S2-01 TaxID=2794021 RepID=UPI0018DE87E4|nr:CBS domain-containing protein [Novosphingopyxis sp. YJ-S2-01]MBH9537323.1 CBS domain-containing protein [Novosphingopyxis sp. YJ-S2-01]